MNILGLCLYLLFKIIDDSKDTSSAKRQSSIVYNEDNVAYCNGQRIKPHRNNADW